MMRDFCADFIIHGVINDVAGASGPYINGALRFSCRRICCRFSAFHRGWCSRWAPSGACFAILTVTVLCTSCWVALVLFHQSPPLCHPWEQIRNSSLSILQTWSDRDPLMDPIVATLVVEASALHSHSWCQKTLAVLASTSFGYSS